MYAAKGFEGAVTYVDATEGDAECKTKIESQVSSWNADVTTYEDYFDHVDNLPYDYHFGNDYYEYYYYDYDWNVEDDNNGFQSFNFDNF